MKKCIAILSLLIAIIYVHAETLALWPSDICIAKSAREGAAIVTQTSDRRIAVTTGLDDPWPGVAIDFKDGAYDLSRFGKLRITLRNTDTRPLSLWLSVKDHTYGGGSPGGIFALTPGEEGVMVASLRTTPLALDKPLELVGMNGFPSADASGGFDITKVVSTHIFLIQSELGGKPARYEVLSIEADSAPMPIFNAETFLPFVDEFGQFRHADWSGKIHSDADLKNAWSNEVEWLKGAHLTLTNLNKWGGWENGPQLNATGHFRTEKVDGIWWLVDPDGRLFFSHGINCVATGDDTGISLDATGISQRESYFAWLPEDDSPFAQFYGTGWWAPHNFYKDKMPFKTFDFAKANMLRKYGEDWHQTFTEESHTRLKAWGLNTIANWSDPNVYLLRRTPYTVPFMARGPSIEGSGGWWGKFPDPYSAEFHNNLRNEMEQQKRQGTTDDPWCIGYFVDNELSWGKDNSSLAEAALASPPAQPCKIAFKDWLETKYTTVEELNGTWQAHYASWDDFLKTTVLPDRKHAAPDLEAFHTEIAEKYFRTVRDAIREVAPDKLYLGCRIAQGAPSVYRASARYCDVVSVNIYSRQVTLDLPEGSDDKPMLNGEFHFGALDRGMFHAGLVATENQAERAEAYKQFVISCLRHPRYVGTHWFQWRDQPLTGRGDGENCQIGFLTITDQPYPEIIEAARDIARTMYETRHRKEE